MFKEKKSSSIIIFVVFGYVFAISIWFVAWLFIGDVTWWLTVLNRYVPYLFLPALLLLVWVIFVRQYKLVILLLIPFFIFATLYHPYIVPKPVQTKQQPELRVMTYNVLFSNLDYDAVANVILTYQPDFVALQEVQPAMMEALEARLAGTYPYTKIGFEHPYGTTAVFSRHPVNEVYVLNLEADRPAVVMTSEIDDTPVTFISAHLLAYGLWWVKLIDMPETILQRTSDQNRQAQLLVQEIQKHKGLVIVACDCNSKETASSHRILENAMTSAARKSGRRFGADPPANTKQDTDLQHIDYIFYRGDLKSFGVYAVQDSGGSDHLPVLALFSF